MIDVVDFLDYDPPGSRPIMPGEPARQAETFFGWLVRKLGWDGNPRKTRSEAVSELFVPADGPAQQPV